MLVRNMINGGIVMYKLEVQKEAWERLADEIGANFIDTSSIKLMGPIGVPIPMSVELTYKVWTIFLDTYLVSSDTRKPTIYTRMRATYVGNTDFSFTIKRKTVFSRIAKVFGKKPICTGDNVFDDEFVLKSNDVKAVKNLFSSYDLRELAQNINIVNVRTRAHEGGHGYGYQENGKELYYSYSHPAINRAIIDIDKLKDLFSFFKLLLDGLVENQIALNKKSNAKLIRPPVSN